MHDIEMVRQFYGDVEPSPHTRARVRARLNGPARPAHRERSRRGWLLAPLATLVAGAAAFAIVAALPNGGSQTRSPKPQSVPTADAMYLTAVEHAAQQPTGKYWMSDVVEGASWLIPAKTGPYVISAAGSEFFQWTAAAKGAGEAYWGRGVRAFPLTAADRAAWRRAGAPSRFRVWANDHYDVFYASNDEVGSGQGSMSWQIDPSQTGGGTFNGLTLKNLSSMPTAPAALKNWIEANVSRQTDTRNWLSDIATFMENAPLQPAQRSAVMRMLLDQPGVTTLGSVRDLLGRTGVAIGSTGADLGYATRSELFFDQHTGAFLGTEEVLTKPGGTYASMPAGTILGYWLLRSSGWTNTKPAVPHARAFSPPQPNLSPRFVPAMAGTTRRRVPGGWPGLGPSDDGRACQLSLGFQA